LSKYKKYSFLGNQVDGKNIDIQQSIQNWASNPNNSCNSGNVLNGKCNYSANLKPMGPYPTISPTPEDNATYKYNDVIPHSEYIFDNQISNHYKTLIVTPNKVTGRFKPSINEITNICSRLSANDCVNSSLCVLSGDRINEPKCVAGDANGPSIRFEDVNIDYYYYQNQCYGNCPGYLHKP
jgi:hypothetical protein